MQVTSKSGGREREEGRDEGCNQRPDDHRVQERARLAEGGIRVGPRQAAPHRGDRQEAREDDDGEADAQRA